MIIEAFPGWKPAHEEHSMHATGTFVKVGKRVGYIQAHVLADAIALENDLMGGFLVARMESHVGRDPVDDKVLVFPSSLDHVKLAAFREAVTAVLNPPQRTPLTRENLVKFMEGVVERSPTRTVSEWDSKKKEYVERKVPMTVEWLLARMLITWHLNNYAEYKKCELLDSIDGWFMEGVKGYKDYTRDELLSEIEENFMGPDESPYDCGDLEDLLEALRFSEGEGD